MINLVDALRISQIIWVPTQVPGMGIMLNPDEVFRHGQPLLPSSEEDHQQDDECQHHDAVNHADRRVRHRGFVFEPVGLQGCDAQERLIDRTSGICLAFCGPSYPWGETR